MPATQLRLSRETLRVLNDADTAAIWIGGTSTDIDPNGVVTDACATNPGDTGTIGSTTGGTTSREDPRHAHLR